MTRRHLISASSLGSFQASKASSAAGACSSAQFTRLCCSKSNGAYSVPVPVDCGSAAQERQIDYLHVAVLALRPKLEGARVQPQLIITNRLSATAWGRNGRMPSLNGRVRVRRTGPARPFPTRRHNRHAPEEFRRSRPWLCVSVSPSRPYARRDCR